MNKMINRGNERWKPDTNQAWEALTTRLVADGLVWPDMIPCRTKAKVRYRRPMWSVAAALICLLTVGVAAWLIGNRNPPVLLCMYNTDNEKFMITSLADGSTVYLAPDGRLTYPDTFASDCRQLQLAGDAFFEVQSDKRPFRIETESVSVEVMGTAFHICSRGSEAFMLSVKSGKVKVNLKGSEQKIEVEAGAWVYLESGRWEKKYINAGVVPDLHPGILHFKDERLAEIIRVVNLLSVSNGSLMLGDQGLEERRLTLTIKTGNRAETVGLLCSALGLTATEQGTTTILREREIERLPQ